MIEDSKLKEFWGNMPSDIKKIVKEFAVKSLGISEDNKAEMRAFAENFYKIYEQCNHIEDVMTRYQFAYGMLMKKYRLTGGGDVPTRFKPFFVSSMGEVNLKDGTKQVLVSAYGLARREDMDGATITYTTVNFWGDSALTASKELKKDVEYKTKLVWKVDKNTGAKTLTVGRNSQLILEPQNDKQFPSFEEFVNNLLQDTTKVIGGLDDLLDFDKAISLNLNSKSPTDIKVLPFVTVIDSRLIDKQGRKLGLMEIIDKSIFTDRDKSLIIWVDEKQLVGRGSILHLFGEVRFNASTRAPNFRLHFIYPIKPVKFIPEMPSEVTVASTENDNTTPIKEVKEEEFEPDTLF